MARRAALGLLAGLWLAAAWAAAAPVVRIVAPRPEEEAFGVLDVEAEVESAEPVERVEFYLTEELVATLFQAPFTQAIVLPPGDPIAYVRAEVRRPNGEVNSPVQDMAGSRMVALTNPVFVTSP